MLSDVSEKDGVNGHGEIDLDAVRRQFDTESRYRKLSGFPAICVSAIAVCMSLFHLYTSGFGLMQAIMQGAVHLAFVLVLVFLLYLILTMDQHYAGIRVPHSIQDQTHFRIPF